MILFLIFSSTYIHSITFIQYIHPSPLAEVPLHLLIAGHLKWEKPPWGAEPGIELGLALKQADALPFELCRILTELRRSNDSDDQLMMSDNCHG